MSFDVYCKCADGSRVIVEMQNYAKTAFIDRALVYTSASILENYTYSKSKDYNVQKTYLVAITGEKIFPKVQHSPVRLALCDMDAEKTTVLNDKILQIFIELPKFASSEKELKENDTFLNQFSVAMKKMATFAERPEVMKDDLVEKMFQAADTVYYKSKEKNDYKKSIMNEFEYEETLKEYRQEGIEEGREEGREEERKKAQQRMEATAKSLKDAGVSLSVIADSTGIPIEKIQSL